MPVDATFTVFARLKASRGLYRLPNGRLAVLIPGIPGAETVSLRYIRTRHDDEVVCLSRAWVVANVRFA
jgi:hypothetical protein